MPTSDASHIDPNSLPSPSGGDDDYITLQDVILFVMRWSRQLIAFTVIGSIIGLAYATLKPRYYESSQVLETDIRGISTIKNPTNAVAAFISIISQGANSRLFAEKFFNTLKAEAAASTETAASAATAYKAIQKHIAQVQGISVDSKDDRATIVGFASYINGPMLEYIHDPSLRPALGFLYLINVVDGGNWLVTIRLDKADISGPIFRATAAGINEVVAIYNKQERDARETYLRAQTDRTRDTLIKARDEYLQFRSNSEKELAKTQVELFKIDAQLRAIEAKAGVASVREREISARSGVLSSPIASTMSATDLAETLNIYEQNLTIRRLAELSQRRVISEKDLEVYMSTLSALISGRSALRAKLDLSERSFDSARAAYATALNKSTAPIDAADYALPTVHDTIAQKDSQQIEQNKILKSSTVKLGFVGLIFGLLLGILFGLFLQNLQRYLHLFKKPVPLT